MGGMGGAGGSGGMFGMNQDGSMPTADEMQEKLFSQLDSDVEAGKLSSDEADSIKSTFSEMQSRMTSGSSGGAQGMGGPPPGGPPPGGPPPDGGMMGQSDGSNSDSSTSSTASTSSTGDATDIGSFLSQFLNSSQNGSSSASAVDTFKQLYSSKIVNVLA